MRPRMTRGHIGHLDDRESGGNNRILCNTSASTARLELSLFLCSGAAEHPRSEPSSCSSCLFRTRRRGADESSTFSGALRDLESRPKQERLPPKLGHENEKGNALANVARFHSAHSFSTKHTQHSTQDGTLQPRRPCFDMPPCHTGTRPLSETHITWYRTMVWCEAMV